MWRHRDLISLSCFTWVSSSLFLWAQSPTYCLCKPKGSRIASPQYPSRSHQNSPRPTSCQIRKRCLLDKSGPFACKFHGAATEQNKDIILKVFKEKMLFYGIHTRFSIEEQYCFVALFHRTKVYMYLFQSIHAGQGFFLWRYYQILVYNNVCAVVTNR